MTRILVYYVTPVNTFLIFFYSASKVRLRADYRDVNYEAVIELEDNTELMREGACFGGTCEL